MTASRLMRADARRNHDRVLAAAREVFGASGADAQVDDVARAAGVGVGTVYRHFPTKEALIGEIVRQSFAQFAERAAEALHSGGDSFESLAWLLRHNAEQLAGDAATRYAMGAGTAVWEAAAAERAAVERSVGELVTRGRRDGSLRPDLTVGDIEVVMCGLASSMARGSDWRRHLELVLDGLRAREGSAGSARLGSAG
jgi:AcrR family transcriptional regulator